MDHCTRNAALIRIRENILAHHSATVDQWPYPLDGGPLARGLCIRYTGWWAVDQGRGTAGFYSSTYNLYYMSSLEVDLSH
jgi:hypothetical protein